MSDSNKIFGKLSGDTPDLLYNQQLIELIVYINLLIVQ